MCTLITPHILLIHTNPIKTYFSFFKSRNFTFNFTEITLELFSVSCTYPKDTYTNTSTPFGHICQISSKFLYTFHCFNAKQGLPVKESPCFFILFCHNQPQPPSHICSQHTEHRHNRHYSPFPDSYCQAIAR